MLIKMGFYSLVAIFTAVAMSNQCLADGQVFVQALGNIVQTLFSQLVNLQETNSKSNPKNKVMGENNAYAEVYKAKAGIIKSFLSNKIPPATASIINYDDDDLVTIKFNKRGQKPLLVNLKPYDPLDNEPLVLEEDGNNNYPVVIQIGKARYPVTIKVTRDEDESVGSDENYESFPGIKLSMRDDLSNDNINQKNSDELWPVLKLVKADTHIKTGGRKIKGAKTLLKSGGKKKSSQLNDLSWSLSNSGGDEEKSNVAKTKSHAKLKTIPVDFEDIYLHPNKEIKIELNVRKENLASEDNGAGVKKHKDKDGSDLENDVKIANLIKDKLKKSRLSKQ